MTIDRTQQSDRSAQYSVRLIDLHDHDQYSYSPVDGEWCDDLTEAREHGQIADVAIFEPGCLAGRDMPLEIWINGQLRAS